MTAPAEQNEWEKNVNVRGAGTTLCSVVCSTDLVILLQMTYSLDHFCARSRIQLFVLRWLRVFSLFLVRRLHCIACPFAVHRTLYRYAITFMFARDIYFVTTTIDSCSCARTVCTTIGCMPRSCVLPKHFRLTFYHMKLPIYTGVLVGDIVDCRKPVQWEQYTICSCSTRERTNVGFLFWRQQSAILLPRSSWHERCLLYVCSCAPTTVWRIP